MTCACVLLVKKARGIERTGGRAEVPLREMQIYGSDFEVAMAEQDLDRTQVRSGLKQMCRETMPQSVRMDVPVVEPGALRSDLAGGP